MAAGAVSLKLPNFLTTSQDVRKGADQAKFHVTMLLWMGIPVTTTTNIWRAFYEEKLHTVGPYYFSLT